jgi:two-component system CheB/CheR fusion protein
VREETDSTDDGAAKSDLPIVAIGASAGGLEALRQLFSRLPADTGMAFVVIQHLDPGRPSMLASVLAADAQMPVVEVAVGMRAEPNRVYVIPPDADLSIHEGLLTLIPRQQTRKLHLPIDSFFRALAADLSERAIGVVLSGSASDGTEGLRAIKAAGGITFAQEPDSAQFRSMPESAIAADVVDFRFSPVEIASEIVRLSRHPYLAYLANLKPPEALDVSADEAPPDAEDSLARILTAVRLHAQLDFRGYKRPTILRRIARRTALRRLGSLSEYAESLGNDPSECKALAQDFLIHVTSFFRDAGAFEALKQHVLPELLTHKDDDASFRVWVPGCSTGEEAYSLAICLLEFLTEERRTPSIKIFGSDMSERAIETARAGLFAEADLEGVSPERVERFFERAEGRYRIGKQVRDLCVFVRHDLTRDPPFAKLDLISCRNLLIYFDVELQRRVLPLLHHCLNMPGYLLLGSSEGIREFDDLFVPSDKEHRIFRKTGESPRIEYPLALGREAESKIPVFQPAQRPQPARDAQRQADHVLLTRYAPPGVVVNERLEVIQFRGRTGDFLESPPGQPQTNILKMAREGLVGPLREAFETAKSQSNSVRMQGVRITDDAQTRSINLEVVPLAVVTPTAENYFLVVFEEIADRQSAERAPLTAPATGNQRATQGRADEEVARLRSELTATRDHLQAISGEHQDTTEELGAANEELIAANEELQSTNEELQSAKEELQSTNEELTTLNDELNNRNQQLDVVASDLVNVLESVQIPVIMVDNAFRIRRFTPTAREIASLLPGDVGRSIDDVKLKVKVDDLLDKIRETIESVTPKEYEVQGLDGRWFKLNIRPYRTTDSRLDGAVLSFLDVDVLKRALQGAEGARDYANRIVETVPMSLVMLDESLRVMSANPHFDRSFASPGNPTGHPRLFELAAGALDVPTLREATERSLATRTSFQDLEIQCTFPGSIRREFVVAGCPIKSVSGGPMLLLAVEDVTKRHLLEASEKQARVEAEQANSAKDLFLATLSHELRTPLSTILMSAQVLKLTETENPKIRRASAAIERAVGNQARLIDDLLDISRIVSGKLMLDLQAVDLASVVQSAVDVAQASAAAKGVALAFTIQGDLRPVHGDAARLQQVATNLLNNSIKFTPKGGKITVDLQAIDGTAHLTVRDTGMGLRAELLPHLFDRFVQAESSMTRIHGGLGLGLAIVRHIVNVHGGQVRAESPGEGRGATFTVTLPLAPQDDVAASIDRRTVTRSVSGVRVLLIEDDDDTREACTTMLEGQGAEVRASRSAAEGLATLETFVPQVILCDLAMPGEDGYAFIHQLRSGNGGRSAIPAAALTALAGEEDRRRVLESGFQMHLAKPIDADRLATAVATLAAAGASAGAPA